MAALSYGGQESQLAMGSFTVGEVVSAAFHAELRFLR